MTMMFSKLFRSKSDFHDPLFELIKQVRIFSRPWINKKMALLELEADYIRQKHVLDVAIRKMEIMDQAIDKMKTDARVTKWARVARRLMIQANDRALLGSKRCDGTYTVPLQLLVRLMLSGQSLRKLLSQLLEKILNLRRRKKWWK